MQVADLLSVLERLAPSYLAQPGDNVGLLVGDEKADVGRVLCALGTRRPRCWQRLSPESAKSCSRITLCFSRLFVPWWSLIPRSAWCADWWPKG